MSEEDEKRILNKALDYSDHPLVKQDYYFGARAECEYWQSKLKERDAMIDLLQRQRQELVDKLNELTKP